MYEISITNSTETKEDIDFNYIKAIIVDKTTRETRTIRFCNHIHEVVEYVNRFAKYLINTKEFEGKLLRINHIGEGLCTS